MKLQEFYYNLPKELIAQYPSRVRDSDRLLVLDRKSHDILHKNFFDIVGYFKRGDLLILNDTKVLSARLIGIKPTGGKVDVLLLRNNGDYFDALIKPKLKLNSKILFNGGKLTAEVVGEGRLSFNIKAQDKIYKFGVMPLPAYIKRMPTEEDKKFYQTVFAKEPGAVASPTAGLHFTKKLLKQFQNKGINIAFVTLHINYATFKPVKEIDISKHKMYREYYNVPKITIERIKRAKASNNRIIAVGTTVARTIETIANQEQGRLSNKKYSGYTNLFIYPGYKFKLTDCLVTNFHLPGTTLLMLVSAFAEHNFILRAYKEAIEKKYRFYSYGDAMLII